MKNCFTQACADSMTSIALPVLGTGNLRSPPGEVSTIILEEVALFAKKNMPTTLTDVYIVVYHKDTAKLDVSIALLTSLSVCVEK